MATTGLAGEVEQAFLVPRGVHDLLPLASSCGISHGGAAPHAWALYHQTLLVWRVDDGLQATVRRLQVPHPLPDGRAFVQVLPRAGSAALSVVVATPAGHVAVWLDAHLLGNPLVYTLPAAAAAAPPPPASEPSTPRTPLASLEEASACSGAAADAAAARPLDALAALAAAPADAGGAPGVVAVAAAANGGLHLLQVGPKGLFPRQFFRPAVPGGAAAGGAGSGILGTLGSVLSSAYAEAFNPLHRLVRRAPSALPARQLALVPSPGGGGGGGGGDAWRLLVLTPEALDCWTLSFGRRSTEEAAWSLDLPGALRDVLHERDTAPLALDVAADRQSLTVWSAGAAHGAGAGAGLRHSLSSFSLRPDMVPLFVGAETMEGLQLPDPQPGLHLPGSFPHTWQLAANASRPQPGCVLRAPNGCVGEWRRPGEPRQLLPPGRGAMAVACSGGASDAWLVLHCALGVLQMGGPSHRTGEGGDSPEGGAAHAGEEAVATAAAALLDTTVDLMLLEFQVGAPYAELAAGLAGRLTQLGAFRPVSGGGGGGGYGSIVGQELVRISAGILDQIGKGAAPASAAVSLREQLGSKAQRHDTLLLALHEGGVLPRLAPAALRVLLEHAQQLASVASLLDSLEQARDLDGEFGHRGRAASALLAAAEAAGGVLADGGVGGGGGTAGGAGAAARPSWELFFSRPSLAAPLLFAATGNVAARVRSELGRWERSAELDAPLSELCGLALALVNCVAAAEAKAMWLQEYPAIRDAALAQQSALPSPGWLVAPAARGAWDHICQACVALKAALGGDVERRVALAARAHVPATGSLLVSYREALRCVLDPRKLAGSYQAARDTHLGSLLEDAQAQLRELSASGALAAGSAAAEGALIWQVESMAATHHAYRQLYGACRVLEEFGLDAPPQRLHQWMRTLGQEPGAGQQDTFALYVCGALTQERRLTELMALGRLGLAQPLHSFLAAHRELLWLAQLQAAQFGEAAETLLAVGASAKDSTSRQRRLLALAKLSSYAANSEIGMQQAEAGLQLLRIQDALGLEGAAPLAAHELAAAALGGDGGDGAAAAYLDDAERALLAVEALAVAPASVRQESRRLWEDAWGAALSATDVAHLAALRRDEYEGRGDVGAYEQGLQETPLYRAVARAAMALASPPAQAEEEGGLTAVLDDVGRQLLESAAGGGDSAAAAAVEDLLRQVASDLPRLLAAAA